MNPLSPWARPSVRRAACGSAAMVLVAGLAAVVPAQAQPRPKPSSRPASTAERVTGDGEQALAASVGLTVEQLDRGLRAAKPEIGKGDLQAAVAAFAAAAPTTAQVAARVLKDVDTSTAGVVDHGPAKDGRKPAPGTVDKAPAPGTAHKTPGPGTVDKASRRAAPVFDQAAVEMFAAELDVPAEAAAAALKRLTGESGGRVTTASALFAEVAEQLGVSGQDLEAALRALKEWLGGRQDGDHHEAAALTARTTTSDRSE